MKSTCKKVAGKQKIYPRVETVSISQCFLGRPTEKGLVSFQLSLLRDVLWLERKQNSLSESVQNLLTIKHDYYE